MLAPALLLLNAATFAVFGTMFLIQPEETAALVELAASGPMGVTELRAFSGGAELGLALFLLIATVRPALRDAGLLLVAVLYTAVASCRVFGILEDGSGTQGVWIILAIEVALATSAAVALFRSSRPPS